MSSDIKIRTRYEKRTPSGVRFSGVSRVKQEFAEEANINNLIARYQRTGVFHSGRISDRKPIFGDFTSVDYHDAQNAKIAVENDFANLDSDVRKYFRNDPKKLLEFLENPENLEKAIELGLAQAHDSLVTSVPADTQSAKKPASDEQGPGPEGSGKSPEAS